MLSVVLCLSPLPLFPLPFPSLPPSLPPSSPPHSSLFPLSPSTPIRYNEFHDLNEKLKKKFPEMGLKLPGKRILGNNFDPGFIKQRRTGLHDFIIRMMKVSCRVSAGACVGVAVSLNGL